MSVRVLTIDEMLALPEGAEAILVKTAEGFDHGDLLAGTTLNKKHTYGNDEISVAFSHSNGAWDFFEEGEVGVVEVTKHPLIVKTHPSKEQIERPAEEIGYTVDKLITGQPEHEITLGVYRPDLEIGNPKVGAASKKYSLRYLPLAANIEANRALENGADKYGLCNWRDTNVKASVYIDAALRHIFQWQEGQQDASDSGVHNLGHAMASLAIIIDAQAQGVLIDDRPTQSKDTDELLLRSA